MSAVAPDAPAKANLRRAGGEAPRGRSLVLVPPEGVPLHLAIPSIGARVAAQTVDMVITIVLTLALVFALSEAEAISAEAANALLSLVFLIAGTPLYILFELLMNGRTPGKRLLGLRVVSLDGRGLTTHQVVLRNLLKEVEIFVPLQLLPTLFLLSPFGFAALAWTLAVIVVTLRSRARQRVGDYAANTVVVEQPKAELLPDLAVAENEASIDPTERFAFTTVQLDLYGAYELQVLEKLLRARVPTPGEAPPEQLVEVAASIRRKIAYPEEVAGDEVPAFLLAFYRAQRAYLEQKKLFGEARGDKFHRGEPPSGDERPQGASLPPSGKGQA